MIDMVWENFEDLIVPDNFGQTFMNFYNEFLNWFMSLDLAGQIISGILIILGLILVGYLIYGILWIIYQIVKGSIVGTILLILFGYIVVKLVFYALIDDTKVHGEWNKSAENLKWFIGVAYPSSKKIMKPNTRQENGDVIEKHQIQKQIITEPPKVFHLRSNNQNNTIALHCPNCGALFTERMNMVMNTKKMTYCELCGQQFIVPNEIYA